MIITDMEEGYLKGEVCNRDGCQGIIAEHDSDGGCSCHINPPCSYCETSREYCPECDWDGREEQLASYEASKPTQEQLEGWRKEQQEWDDARNLFYKQFRGDEPIDKLKIRIESHTHFTQRVIGVFPKGTETQSTLIDKVRGTFGGRWVRFNDYSFEYIAYTD